MAIIGSDRTEVLNLIERKYYLQNINMKNKRIVKVPLGDITEEGSLNLIMDTMYRRGQEGETRNYSSIVRIYFRQAHWIHLIHFRIGL